MAFQGFIFIRFGLYAPKMRRKKKHLQLIKYSVPGISHVVFYLIFMEASSNLELKGKGGSWKCDACLCFFDTEHLRMGRNLFSSITVYNSQPIVRRK